MTIIDDLRAKVDAELAAGRQVDFFEALAADKRVTKAMLVEWMLGPAQRGVKAEREMPALLRVVEAARRLAQWRNERGSITAGVVIGGHAWDELAAALAELEVVAP